eukprot:GILK01009167.1.p1 GENE.GILK01009167.1~~GILK01009167.1.p1  ORF type:complete len:818 (-),score=179.17 GILK01009167.1:144-2567(-)
MEPISLRELNKNAPVETVFKRRRRKNDKILKADQELFKQEEEEEQNTVTAEDLEFFDEYSQFSGFLKNLDQDVVNPQLGKKRHKKNKDQEEDAEYEKAPRAPAWDQNEKAGRLPIKTDAGIVEVKDKQESSDLKPLRLMEKSKQQPIALSVEDTQEAKKVERKDKQQRNKEEQKRKVELKRKREEQQSEEAEARAKEADQAQTRTAKRLPQRFSMDDLEHMTFDVKKEAIAKTSDVLMSDPDHNIRRLNDLYLFCGDSDLRVVKMATLSLLVVYKDIIPGYRVRLPTEKELQQRVSKEVQALREFESSLLASYQQYLIFLEKLITEHEKAPHNTVKRMEQRPLHIIALQAMAELLTTHLHFNFRSNIVGVLIPRANARDERVREICVAAIRKVFEVDTQYETVLEVVGAISKLVKQKMHLVRPALLDTFLSLKLMIVHADDSHKKKGSKEDMQLQQELAEANAELTTAQKQKIHTELIKEVFVTYFRVLKLDSNSPLLPSVLRGLARFSHLVNVELVFDLIEAIKGLLAEETLPFSSAVNCVKTAFQTLEGPGQALTTDVKELYSHTYAFLPNLMDASTTYPSDTKPQAPSTNGAPRKGQHDVATGVVVPVENGMIQAIPAGKLQSTRKEEELKSLLWSLELICLKKRQLSQERMAAFLKRFLSLAVHMEAHICLSLLVLVRGIFQRYSRTAAMLDSEQVSSAVYLPEIQDPEHCNAFAASTWELVLLQTHYHPTVRAFAKSLACQSSLDGALATLSPAAMLDEFSSKDMTFNPPIPKPRSVSTKSSKRRRDHSVSEFVSNLLSKHT